MTGTHRHPDELEGTWEWERAQWLVDPTPSQASEISRLDKRYHRIVILRRIVVLLWFLGCTAFIVEGVVFDKLVPIWAGIGMSFLGKNVRDVFE